MLKKKKTKLFLFGSIVMIAVLLISQVVLVSGKDKKEEIMYREYPVTQGDIIVGIDGYGSLKLEGESYRYEEEIVVDEVLVKVGDSVKKEQKLAKLSIESIDEKIKTLNDEKAKVEGTVSQTKNNKDIQQTTSDSSWNDITQNSKNLYDTKKQQLESSINQTMQQVDAYKARIAEIEALISQVPSTLIIEENVSESKPDIEALKLELEEKKKLLVESESKVVSLNQNLVNLNNARQQEVDEENRKKSEKDSIQSKNNQNFDTSLTQSYRDLDRINQDIQKYVELKKNPYLISKTEGVVLEIGYENDKTVDPLSSGITVGIPSNQYVLASVEQESIVKIKEGQKVELQFNAYGDEIFEGVVKKRDLVGKNKNGTIVYEIVIELSPTDRELLSEMTCNLSFITKEVKDVVKLSNKAIQFKDGKQIVNVLMEDSTIVEKEIKTGFSDGKVSEVIDGLSSGDIVVVGE
ncbi:MAG: hypothetical protein RR568_04375 [Anaerorhabdus sp.]|uniref:hypothetical protein n=1 Tax=Anaerorhabdus sp. TaxID=1872524 RepID=UPI002FC7BB82